MVEVFKIVHGTERCRGTLLPLRIIEAMKLMTSVFRTGKRKSSVVQPSTKAWHSLPLEVAVAIGLSDLKKRLDKRVEGGLVDDIPTHRARVIVHPE